MNVQLKLEIFVSIFFFICVGQLFCHSNCAVRNRLKIKSDMKIGGSASSFHIEHLHSILLIVLKTVNRLPCTVCFTGIYKIIIYFLFVPVRSIRKNLCIFVQFIKRCRHRLSCTNIYCYNTRCKINRTAMGIVFAANIQNKNVIDIHPHIIIAVEFEHHLLVTICDSTFRLQEISRHLHAEVIINSVT